MSVPVYIYLEPEQLAGCRIFVQTGSNYTKLGKRRIVQAVEPRDGLMTVTMIFRDGHVTVMSHFVT